MFLSKTPSTRLPRSSRRAFTLIELLTVIAIIGILAAIIIPTTSSARAAARKARTRAQFSQWGAAIETFRQEYGYYPTFAVNNKVNGTTTPGNLATLHQFHDTLVGTRRDGSALPATTPTGSPPPPQVQNSRRIAFLTFTEADIVPQSFTDTTLRSLIRDAFDNTDIAVLVDRNLDGKIALGATGGDGINPLPTVRPPDNTAVTLTPTTGTTGDFPTGANVGVRAGVIFYCAPPKATSQADLLMSWK